jgi:hypothetical protein
MQLLHYERALPYFKEIHGYQSIVNCFERLTADPSKPSTVSLIQQYQTKGIPKL